MHWLRERITNTYFSLDLRSLALFRIVLAGALLCDLWLRAQVLDVFYTNEGLLPNHTLLWSPINRQVFSLFFTASHHTEALCGMLLCALAFVCLMFGYQTRVAQVASLLALVSLDGRLAPLENGGDVVLNLLCMWSVVLPLGERCSLDALLRSLAARKESMPAQLNQRAGFAPKRNSVRSLACCALIFQLFFIYFFNVAHKSGPSWLDGSAVHYTLHQDRIVKPLGIWVREHLPVPALLTMTRTTIVAECVAAAAVISPFFTNVTRGLLLLLVPGLHVSFELCLDLGVFSFAMIAFCTLFPSATHWTWLRGKLSRMYTRRRVYVDEDCGFCMLCARILARLDVLHRIEFASNADVAGLPPGTTTELADKTILVLDVESGRVHQRADAFAAICLSLPFGALVAWPLRLAGGLANAAYDLVARNRQALSIWLGYNACGIPLPLTAADTAESDVAPVERLVSGTGRWLREGLVALCMLAAAYELANANAAVPSALRVTRPAWLQGFINYPRALQGWGMFAPHAPREDYMIEIDALTADGRHVDPYNQLASREFGPGLTRIPAGMRQNQFFTAYSLFASWPGFLGYRQAFQEWILRYPERTGNPNDRIVSYRVWKLSDRSPPLGKTEPTQFERSEFMSYPH